MGFGILFLGTLSFLCLRITPVDIIGFVLVYCASSKLGQSEKRFNALKKYSITGFIYSLIYGTYFILNISDIIPKNTVPYLVLEYERFIYFAFMFLFHRELYLAINAISKECGYEKGIKKAKKCFSLSLVYIFSYIIYILLNTLYSVFDFLKNDTLLASISGLNVAIILFCFLWLAYSSHTIYLCYMNIATQEMLEKERRVLDKYNRRK